MDSLLRSLADQPLGRNLQHVLSKVLSHARMPRQHSSILVAVIALSYILLCRSLRYRRVTSQRRKLGYSTQESLRRMTNEDAHAIIGDMSRLEFPLVFKQSLSFALFKTYGVPTISGLLVATRMFSTPENASRRYEDTSLLIGEFLTHAPGEQRTVEAIARMNYIHSPYLKAGKISNDDLLYTLSVFITEPISWVNRFEWRDATDVEICALGTFWKSIGDAMGIDYSDLKHDSWDTGIDFYHDVKEWSMNYEARVMRPCETNKTTAVELVSLLLHHVPRPMKGFARQVVGLLMGERLAWAMSYPEPSIGASAVILAAFTARRFILRHLSLPRIYPVSEFTEKDPKTGKYYHTAYLVHPYYVKPTFLNRWGPTAWVTWMLGGVVPGGKDGQKYYPEGYTMLEVGPDKKRGQGESEMEEMSQFIRQARPLGCPFSVK